MSYLDETYETHATYTGHYCDVIKRNPNKPIKLDDVTFFGAAEIQFDVEYYYAANNSSELDLDLNSMVLINEAGYEIAWIHKLTDDQLIELGFPYDQELAKANAEAE